MRRTTVSRLAATTAALGALAFSSTALAQQGGAEPPPPGAPAPAAAPAPVAPPPVVDGDGSGGGGRTREFKPFAITINPLSMILARYSFNFEYMLAEHHGLIVSPHGQFFSDSTGDTYSNYGGELGYHFYTGVRGANGFFVGPSLVYTALSIKDAQTNTSAGFSAYGAAIDIGGQHVFDFGLTIGGGFGLMYLNTSSSVNNNSMLKISGVLPRFLFTAGYSF